MAREFYEGVADALRGFLPASLRDFSAHTGGHNLKIWYESLHEHYEVQMVSRAALAASKQPARAPMLEIGFHAEHPNVARNDALLERFHLDEPAWRMALGPEAVAGPFIGRPAISQRWRRISELWDGPNLQTTESAIEAADRLATYVRALEPVRTQPVRA